MIVAKLSSRNENPVFVFKAPPPSNKAPTSQDSTTFAFPTGWWLINCSWVLSQEQFFYSVAQWIPFQLSTWNFPVPWQIRDPACREATAHEGFPICRCPSSIEWGKADRAGIQLCAPDCVQTELFFSPVKCRLLIGSRVDSELVNAFFFSFLGRAKAVSVGILFRAGTSPLPHPKGKKKSHPCKITLEWIVRLTIPVRGSCC